MSPIQKPDADCPICHGSGWTCEAHPAIPSAITSDDDPAACRCGAPAVPCDICYGIRVYEAPPDVPFEVDDAVDDPKAN